MGATLRCPRCGTRNLVEVVRSPGVGGDLVEFGCFACGERWWPTTDAASRWLQGLDLPRCAVCQRLVWRTGARRCPTCGAPLSLAPARTS